MKIKKIAIIGAGPAGIFTALFLKDFAGEVHLFEQNADIGEKLKRTGGGRMNVANKKYDASCFFSSSEELKNSFFKNPLTQQILALLQELNIEYEWEGFRALLKSKNAKAEVARLKKMLQEQSNLHLHQSQKVEKIIPKNNQYEIETQNTKAIFDAVVISTGGMFRIHEEAKEKVIYNLVSSLQCTIVPTSPSLSPLIVSNHLLSSISGVSLPFQLYSPNTLPEKNDGLITHFGFSGPVVLDFTAYWNGKDPVFINFLPDFPEKKLLEHFKNPHFAKKNIVSVLSLLLPKRLAEKILEINGIVSEKKIAESGKKDWQKISNTIYRYELKNSKTLPFQGTWTTKGGVCLEKINMHSLELKEHKNCFLAGEVMDINGLCGGYHISFCLQCAKIIALEIMKKK